MTMSDQAHMLQEIGGIRELRLTTEAVQVDHDHRVQSGETKFFEEYIFRREMNLEHEVRDKVWSLYMHKGEEGIKVRHEKRKLKAVPSRVEAEISG